MPLFNRQSDNSDDDDGRDYFDGPDLQEQEPEPPKPQPKPDNIDYWEEESEWEHLRPVGRWRVRLYVVAAVIVAIVLLAGYIYFFRPYVSDAVQFGYVDHIEARGNIFKTYEGTILPYKELHDTTRIYDRNFDFSAADAKVASRLKRMQIAGQPVRVEYRRYHTRIPWRGDSKVIIVSADSVDPSTILPPDFLNNPGGAR